MSPARNSPVWLVSFVDLCLVLLGFFVMLHAMSGNQRQLVQGLRDRFSGAGGASVERRQLAPQSLFQPGEALFRDGKREELRAFGAQAAARAAHVRVTSVGTDKATNRFDGWELSAARTAAVARAIQSGGLAADAIDIALSPTKSAEKSRGQRIEVEIAK